MPLSHPLEEMRAEMPTKSDFREHANIENEDPRLRAITTVVAPASVEGLEFDAGTPLKLVGNTGYRDGVSVAFGIPNMAALFLHYSLRLRTEAEEGFADESFLGSPSSSAIDNVLFDLIERRIGSVIFAYTAVESYVNQEIPTEFHWEQERSDSWHAKFPESRTTNGSIATSAYPHPTHGGSDTCLSS